MLKRFALSSVLDLYRRISIALSVLLAISACAALYALLATVWGGHPGPVAIGMALCLGAALTGFAGLRFAYFQVERALLEADRERQDMLAQAHRDALTGAYTRSYFLSTLTAHMRSDIEAPMGFMQIDLDHLKSLNDINGHAAGDAALRYVTETIRQLVPNAIIGRLGGDEFAVAFPGETSKAGLRRLGERLLAEIASPTQIVGRRMSLSATIGLAVAPHDGASLDEIMVKADLALYHGKRQGRGCVTLFEPSMLGDERYKRVVERELRAALLLNELELFYQPILDATGKTRIAYEALVRWHHPVRGLMTPGDFIAVAEESDLIDKIGAFVLRQACADLVRLDAPAVHINVSARQLRRPDFYDDYAAIIAQAGVAPSRLVVEITETAALARNGPEMAHLVRLRELGVAIAIDDFGAGHTSLQYLRGFPFDIIKIDKSYVCNIATNMVDGMIVRSICDVARTIGAQVVAEGIEHPDQMAVLQAAGVTALQGYYLGRPGPLGRLAAPASVASAA